VDQDTVSDCVDNCPTSSNSNQANADLDALGDVCDTCTDSDDDGLGDPGYPYNACPDDECTDTDGDGYGDPGFVNTCALDCAPGDPLIHPGAPEDASQPTTCNDGVDNDCDGVVDADCGQVPSSHLASSPSEGTASGSLSSLSGNPDGNTYFTLTETGNGSQKRVTRIFQFNGVPTGISIKLFVEGYRNNASADNFEIRYRTVSSGSCPNDTGTSGWTNANLPITTALPDNGTLQSKVLGSSSNSTWCIRLQDTVRSGDSTANTLSLDTLVLKPQGFVP